MYGRTFSSVLATFAVGAGAAAPPPALARPAPGPRVLGDGATTLLSSAARTGVYERADAHDAAASGAESETVPPTPAAPGQYDTSGLAETDDLAAGEAQAADPNQARAAHLARALRAPAATAYAAPLTASQDTCMGARTFGIQAMGFGVSFATTWQDRHCRRIKNARELFALGYPEAAIQLLCMDQEVYDAMERAGTPCPTIRFIRIIEPEPQPEPEPAPPPLITFDDVLFDFDRSTLRPEANSTLEPLLAMLQADPEMRIDIEGHTDWVGSDAYNQGLSERRARAVVNWLVAHGIDRERVSSVGRGESEPVATNASAEGRQLNRRVEIRRR